MSDENKIRDAADAIKGIAEAVPVYQDVLQPAAKEIGTSLQIVARSIRVALAPLTALVWGYDRIADYLDSALTDKFKDVPPERIITPNPTVAGPTVESLRFAAHEPSLRELYVNLLATSMDSATAQNSHPAFVDIIRQLSPDEARLIQILASNKVFTVLPLSVTFGEIPTGPTITQLVSFLVEQAKCEHPELAMSYLDNLRRLGLTQSTSGNHEEHARLKTHPEYLRFKDKYVGKPGCRTVRGYDGIVLTDLGRQFCRACVSKQSEE